MIKSFKNKDTEQVFDGVSNRRFQSFAKQALRRLVMIDEAASLNDLRLVPGNRLEALSGDREGQYSVRINRQWRICFRWSENAATEVEIVDYHKG